MTRVFEKHEFHSVNDRDSSAVFEEYEFRRCRFVGSSLSITRDVRRRSTIRRVKVIDCEELGCALNCAVVEETLVDGLKTSDLFQTWGAVFKHVTLRGRIGRIMLSPVLRPGSRGFAPPEQQRALDEANRRYYETVDWALDIREAEFAEADLRGVPGHLLRRDPATQALVRREQALKGTWREVDFSGTHWSISLEHLAKDSRFESKVLVAERRALNFKTLLAVLARLREAGIAEPD